MRGTPVFFPLCLAAAALLFARPARRASAAFNPQTNPAPPPSVVDAASTRTLSENCIRFFIYSKEISQTPPSDVPLALLLELEDGTLVHLDVMYRLYGISIGYGPVALLFGEVTAPGGEVRAPDEAHRWFSNPDHHLLDPQYRLTFEKPIGDAYGIYVRGGTLYGIGVPDEFEVCWLDQNHDCLRPTTAVKETWTTPAFAFRGVGLRLH